MSLYIILLAYWIFSVFICSIILYAGATIAKQFAKKRYPEYYAAAIIGFSANLKTIQKALRSVSSIVTWILICPFMLPVLIIGTISILYGILWKRFYNFITGKNKWPKDYLRQKAIQITNELGIWQDAEMTKLYNESKDAEEFAIALHHGVGTNIRNLYNLWDTDSELNKYYRTKMKVIHPDDMSHDLLKRIYDLQKETPDWVFDDEPTEAPSNPAKLSEIALVEYDPKIHGDFKSTNNDTSDSTEFKRTYDDRGTVPHDAPEDMTETIDHIMEEPATENDFNDFVPSKTEFYRLAVKCIDGIKDFRGQSIFDIGKSNGATIIRFGGNYLQYKLYDFNNKKIENPQLFLQAIIAEVKSIEVLAVRHQTQPFILGVLNNKDIVIPTTRNNFVKPENEFGYYRDEINPNDRGPFYLSNNFCLSADLPKEELLEFEMVFTYED